MKIFKSTFLLWASFLSILFAVMSTFIPRIPLMSVLNGIFLGLIIAIIIVYSPLAWYAIKKGKGDRVTQLSLGIGLTFFSLACQRIYWLVWNAYGMPDSWQSNPISLAFVFISIIGVALFVTAPGYPADDKEIIDKIGVMGANRNMLILFGAAGGLTAFVLSVYFKGIIL